MSALTNIFQDVVTINLSLKFYNPLESFLTKMFVGGVARLDFVETETKRRRDAD